MDPKENVVAIGPKKGACYICGGDLLAKPSLQVQVSVPFVKMKRVVGRCCTSCANEFRELISLRICQAERGEFQA